MSDPVIANDPIAVSSAGMMRSGKPAAPTLTLSASDGTVVATINGDAGVTNYLKYKSSSQSSWQDGGSRSGDGTITVTGLESGIVYVFIAYSKSAPGLYSLPSTPQTARFSISSGTENDFDAMLADTADDFLTDFGESGEYLPVGGGSREILAVVDREPPITLEGGAGASLLFITVKNSADNGISSSEVNFNGDMYKLPVRIGETAVEKKIARAVSQDAGMMMLELV